MNPERPTLGAIVHYMAYGTPGGEYPNVCRAAVVTEVGVLDGEVGLAVINPTGMFFNRRVPHHSEGLPGTWHWPSGEGRDCGKPA